MPAAIAISTQNHNCVRRARLDRLLSGIVPPHSGGPRQRADSKHVYPRRRPCARRSALRRLSSCAARRAARRRPRARARRCPGRARASRSRPRRPPHRRSRRRAPRPRRPAPRRLRRPRFARGAARDRRDRCRVLGLRVADPPRDLAVGVGLDRGPADVALLLGRRGQEPERRQAVARRPAGPHDRLQRPVGVRPLRALPAGLVLERERQDVLARSRILVIAWLWPSSSPVRAWNAW